MVHYIYIYIYLRGGGDPAHKLRQEDDQRTRLIIINSDLTVTRKRGDYDSGSDQTADYVRTCTCGDHTHTVRSRPFPACASGELQRFTKMAVKERLAALILDSGSGFLRVLSPPFAFSRARSLFPDPLSQCCSRWSCPA
jgi:hypothetical protein